MDIHSGKIKGFAHVPDTIEGRRTYFKSYMRRLIYGTVEKVIFKYKSSATKDVESYKCSSKKSEYQFRIEKIVI